jgi:hypothetical protein
MENKINSVGFALTKITTEQYALIEDGFSENGNITVVTNFRFGAYDKQKLIAFFSTFTFESDQKPFIVIEAGCHFVIEETAWSQMYDSETNSLIVPKGLISHFAMLTVGTTRGILHTKTESTKFNKYVLPTINVSELIKEDAIFKFD